MSDETQNEPIPVEKEASQMGWVPEGEFKGDPTRWVDAETFVKRGHEVMPILKKNNERLMADVNTLKGELTKVTAALQESRESIEALKTLNNDTTLRKAKEDRQTIVQRIKEARTEGDVDAEVDLVEQLNETTEAIRAAEAEPAPKKAAPTQPQVSPADAAAYAEWHAQNPWYGQDHRRSALAVGIGQELRMNPEFSHLKGRAFLDKVAEEVEKTLAPARSTNSKVEGARGGGGNSGSGGKSYGDLPADAKAACERQVGRLVGEGKAFKTKNDLQKYWTTKFFEE